MPSGASVPFGLGLVLWAKRCLKLIHNQRRAGGGAGSHSAVLDDEATTIVNVLDALVSHGDALAVALQLLPCSWSTDSASVSDDAPTMHSALSTQDLASDGIVYLLMLLSRLRTTLVYRAAQVLYTLLGVDQPPVVRRIAAPTCSLAGLKALALLLYSDISAVRLIGVRVLERVVRYSSPVALVNSGMVKALISIVNGNASLETKDDEPPPVPASAAGDMEAAGEQELATHTLRIVHNTFPEISRSFQLTQFFPEPELKPEPEPEPEPELEEQGT